MLDYKVLPNPEYTGIKMEMCSIRNIAATGYYGTPTGVAYSMETNKNIGSFLIVGLEPRDEAMYPKDDDMQAIVLYNPQSPSLNSYALRVGLIIPLGFLPQETREDIIIQVSTSRSMAELLTKNTAAWAYIVNTGDLAIKYNDTGIVLGNADTYVILTKDGTRLGGEIIFDNPDKTLLLRTNLLAAAFPLTEAAAGGYPLPKTLDLASGELMKYFIKIGILVEGIGV